MWRDWSPEKKAAAVREKARLCLSASEIAKELTDELGEEVTRSAVLGVATRANFRIGKAIDQRGMERPGPVRKRNKPLLMEPPIEITGTEVHLLDVRDGQCRHPVWPDRVTGGSTPNHVGKPSYDELMFCGAATIEGSAYCQEHHDRSVDTEATKSSKRKKAA